MTLQTRLAALVSAIGADIKQLKSSGGGATESAPDPESTHRLYPDADYVCRLTETRWYNSEIKSRSWLGGLTDGQYTTRNEAIFAKNGYTLLQFNTFNLNYYPNTSVLKSEYISTTKSISDGPTMMLFNDLVRIKSQTPSEIWTSFTQWGDNTVFNGTSLEIGVSALPIAAGAHYAEFYFDGTNSAHAIFGIALDTFNIDQDTLGGANFDSVVYNTQTGQLRYGDNAFSTATAADVTECTYSLKLDVSNNAFTIYRTAGGNTTTVLSITSPMTLNGAYFIYSGANSFVRTKFRVNYGDFGWDYSAGATGTNGARATFK